MSSGLTLVLGDIHLPWKADHIGKPLDAIISNLKPKRIVQLGDMLDCVSISRWSKDPEVSVSLKSEVSTARDVIASLMDCAPAFHMCEGNHEYRLHKRLCDEPDLMSTHPTMRELLGVPERDWTPYMKHKVIGKMTYTHDLGYSGVSALRQTMLAYGGNICFGHTHRAGTMYGGNTRGERHVAMNVGWLGDATAMDYLPDAKKVDWQVAVGVVDESIKGSVHAFICPFVDGKFLVGK